MLLPHTDNKCITSTDLLLTVLLEYITVGLLSTAVEQITSGSASLL